MTDTRNPNDPRRFTKGYPDDEERRFEELFARSQKVMDTPAQLAVVDSAATALTTRVVVLEARPILTARVEVLEASDPILKARVTALEANPDVVLPTYTKFKNGTLICLGQIDAVLGAGGVTADTLTFPVAFIAAPTVSVGPLPQAAPAANAINVIDLLSITTTTVQARARTWDSPTLAWVITGFRCQVTAVGRWK